MSGRREFLKSVGVAGAGLAALKVGGWRSASATDEAPGSSSPSGVWGVDVHHHILPPEYVATVGEEVIGAPASGRAPKWTAERSLAAMDANQIATAIVSVSAPGVWFGEVGRTARLARSCNEFAAQLASDHPARFGVFATLPLPDVRASLEEIAHALDVLKADGVVLMTNYDDRYLGEPHFQPVFDELNRRQAVVYVHPTTCTCGMGVQPDIPSAGIEFPHDTTRAVVSLLFSGTFGRCKDIRFIFSHAGGTVPYLAGRIAGLPMIKPVLAERVPEGVIPTLKRLHYDTALSANPMTLAALFRLVSAKNVVLGTDFPFAPEPAVKATCDGLAKFLTNSADLDVVSRENAVKLFPRLADLASSGKPG